MCGILGQIGVELDEAVFGRALDAIAHRGPDGQGTFTHARDVAVRLGHRRLAIIDLSEAGAQPMTSADGRFTIVFNGEIYNFAALRAELAAAGTAFRSQTDTEVLLELFARVGPSAFSRLNGMFALAIYDRATGTVTLARDHLGVKPLYYSEAGGRFAFGSEIKSLLALGVPARLHRERLGEYLAYMWVQEPDTLFAGIHKLPAGHWARYADGRLQVERYWQPLAPGGGPPLDAPLERLEVLLAEAVRDQLVSDRPVGAYISGGVDSSLITHLAARHAPDMVAVSARLSAEDLRYEGIPDDGTWADRFAADHPTLRHTSLTLSADLYDTYKAMIWHMDEPIADAAVVPAYLLAERARSAGAVVMLSGMGGDELFGGYSRYSALQVLEAGEAVPAALRGGMLVGASALQRFTHGPLRRKASHIQRFLQASVEGWPLSYLNLIGHFGLAEIDALAGPSWRAAYGRKLADALAGHEDASRLVQAQLLDLKGFLASHNLIYSDKASMAASVEVRVPLLDHRLAELAFQLPDALRATRGEEKVLLKRLCARMVGPDYAYRPKAGFAMPVRSWLQGPLRAEVTARLEGDRLCTLFERRALRVLWDDHVAGRCENTWKLWTLLTLDLWLERFDVA